MLDILDTIIDKGFKILDTILDAVLDINTIPTRHLLDNVLA